MVIKDILLHLDDTSQCKARLDLAINLAKQHQACLTGLYVITHPMYVPQSDEAQHRSTEAGKMFTERSSQAGIEARWQCIDCHVAGVGVSEIIIGESYYTDLVIIGQPEQGAADNSSPADFSERIILGSGRPVLVIPYAGQYTTVGERALISWRVGREAARAVNDALPLLGRAKQVQIVTVNAQLAETDGESGTCARMCSHLLRHGVDARARHMTLPEGAVGDLLLNIASDEAADLLIVGAFNPRQRGSSALGPVARHLLRYSAVPLLMSH